MYTRPLDHLTEEQKLQYRKELNDILDPNGLRLFSPLDNRELFNYCAKKAGEEKYSELDTSLHPMRLSTLIRLGVHFALPNKHKKAFKKIIDAGYHENASQESCDKAAFFQLGLAKMVNQRYVENTDRYYSSSDAYYQYNKTNFNFVAKEGDALNINYPDKHYLVATKTLMMAYAGTEEEAITTLNIRSIKSYLPEFTTFILEFIKKHPSIKTLTFNMEHHNHHVSPEDREAQGDVVNSILKGNPTISTLDINLTSWPSPTYNLTTKGVKQFFDNLKNTNIAVVKLTGSPLELVFNGLKADKERLYLITYNNTNHQNANNPTILEELRKVADVNRNIVIGATNGSFANVAPYTWFNHERIDALKARLLARLLMQANKGGLHISETSFPDIARGVPPSSPFKRFCGFGPEIAATIAFFATHPGCKTTYHPSLPQNDIDDIEKGRRAAAHNDLHPDYYLTLKEACKNAPPQSQSAGTAIQVEFDMSSLHFKDELIIKQVHTQLSDLVEKLTNESHIDDATYQKYCLDFKKALSAPWKNQYEQLKDFKSALTKADAALSNADKTTTWSQFVINALAIISVLPALVLACHSYYNYGTARFWQPQSKRERDYMHRQVQKVEEAVSRAPKRVGS